MGRILDELKRRASVAVLVQGPCALAGTVSVQGAKNTALKVIPALAGFPAAYRLRNVPMIIDTLELLAILEFLGAAVTFDDDRGDVLVDTTALDNKPIPYAMTRSTTTAFYFAGALLGRFGSVEIGKPGGDEIGARPVDLHLQGFRDVGAAVVEDAVCVRAELDEVPREAAVAFPHALLGRGGQHFARGRGRRRVGRGVERAPRRRHVGVLPVPGDLFVTVRQSSGGMGITGCGSLPAGHTVTFECPPDRNDAFTWLAAGALSHDGIEIHGVDVADLTVGLDPLLSLASVMGPPRCHEHGTTWRCQ